MRNQNRGKSRRYGARPKFQARIPLARGACLLALLFVVGVFGEEVEMQTVLTLEGQTLTIVYSVPRARLVSDGSTWDPEHEAFPADLQACGRKAKEYLLAQRDIPDPIDLFNVTVHRAPDPIKKNGEANPSRRKRWFIEMNFTVHKGGSRRATASELEVVMLLDGTIAEDRLLKGEFVYPKKVGQEQRPTSEK